MIVISNPTPVSNEIILVQNLFLQGLQKFHLRKPFFTKNETASWISKIGLEHHSKIVLHQHFELTADFNIPQIHLKESDRENFDLSRYQNLKISTSVHNIDTFNNLSQTYCYAFLSPIFPSFSKPEYRSDISWKEALKKRTNFQTKLIALGGIDATTVPLIQEFGFDDYALLGTIWLQKDGLKNFELCQRLDHLF